MCIAWIVTLGASLVLAMMCFQVDQGIPLPCRACIASIRHPVHLIVDDGSHFRHQLSSFSFCSISCSSGGLYIFEDVETSIWITVRIFTASHRKLHNCWSGLEVLSSVIDYTNRLFSHLNDRAF